MDFGIGKVVIILFNYQFHRVNNQYSVGLERILKSLFFLLYMIKFFLEVFSLSFLIIEYYR